MVGVDPLSKKLGYIYLNICHYTVESFVKKNTNYSLEDCSDNVDPIFETSKVFIYQQNHCYNFSKYNKLFLLMITQREHLYENQHL